MGYCSKKLFWLLKGIPTGKLRSGSVLAPTPPPLPPVPKPPVVSQLGQVPLVVTCCFSFGTWLPKKHQWHLRKARTWLDPPQPPPEPLRLGNIIWYGVYVARSNGLGLLHFKGFLVWGYFVTLWWQCDICLNVFTGSMVLILLISKQPRFGPDGRPLGPQDDEICFLDAFSVGVTICFRFVFQSSSLNGYSAIVLLDACPAQDLWLLPHGLYGVASSKSVGWKKSCSCLHLGLLFDLQHGLLAKICYSWTVCNHVWANAVHEVTACDMGLLLETLGYCLWTVRKIQFWSELKLVLSICWENTTFFV